MICSQCKKCGECGKPYSSNSNYAERCKDFEKKKITNFERIKQMSVDEMAYFLNGFFTTCELCTHNTKKGGMGCTGGCIDGKTHWLESEAENEH